MHSLCININSHSIGTVNQGLVLVLHSIVTVVVYSSSKIAGLPESPEQLDILYIE